MKLAIALYLAVVIQTTWLADGLAWANGARLDLPLLVVISCGLLGGWRQGAVLGLAAGWLCGVAAAYNLGSFMVSRLCVGAVGGVFAQRFSRDNPLLAPLCMAGGTVLAHLVFGVMSPADFVQPWPRLLASAALNAVAGSAIHSLMARFVCVSAMPHHARRFV